MDSAADEIGFTRTLFRDIIVFLICCFCFNYCIYGLQSRKDIKDECKINTKQNWNGQKFTRKIFQFNVFRVSS